MNIGVSELPEYHFTLNPQTKKMNQYLQAEPAVHFSNTATCNVYELSLNTETDMPSLTEEFKALVKQSYEQQDWTEFINTYGTHFMYKTRVGGRMTVLQTINSESYKEFHASAFNLV